MQILGLVRLRLEALRLTAPVEEMTLTAVPVKADAEQLLLFARRPRRELEAANRALARLRAAFGSHAVLRARLTAGHLPAGQFRWEPLERLEGEPRPRLPSGETAALVRRLYAKPVQLASPSRHDADGWVPSHMTCGPVLRLHGPYIVAGRWWRGAVHREYYFADMQRGDVLWVFYDRPRRRWFLEGRVE